MRLKISMLLLSLAVLCAITGCAEVQGKDGKDGTPGQQKPAGEEQPDANALTALAEGYRDLYEQAAEENCLNTIEAKEQIIQRLAQSGYAVVDTENRINMENPESPEQFCRAAVSKEKAQTVILSVNGEGGFVCYCLETEEGELHVDRSTVYWEEGEPVVGYEGIFDAESWEYTEKGYLFFEEYHMPGYDGPHGLTGIRILPLDDSLRELNERYVYPAGYDGSALLTENWTKTDFGNLDFYDLYDVAYRMKYGVRTSYDTGVISRESWIPAEEFENVVQTYFSADVSVIRKHTVYSEERGAYRYRPRGMYDSCAAYVPYPEVTAREEMPDGTLKLTVEAVWIIEAKDQAMVSELTVLPLEDGGFRYVSNEVVSGTEKPEWFTPRLADGEWQSVYQNG